MQGINISCPINELSYGIVSKNILDQFIDLNIKFNLFSKNQFSTVKYQKYADYIPDYDSNIDLEYISFNIWHEFDIFTHIGKGPRVSFPIFEKDKFSKKESWHIKHQDAIVVCSEWAKTVVENYFNKKIIVAPLGVDTEKFKPNYFPNKDKVIFYSLGKREVRKGHDYLHKVFDKAFSSYTDVELWMFSNNVFDSVEEQQSFQLSYKKILQNKVKFFPRLQDLELINWLNRTDCGIFLSRAEGWNMPLLESMALGKDVLATYYSGHTEFLPIESGIVPVSYEEAIDHKWFYGGFNWVKIEDNEEEIVYKLRKMYESKKEKRELNQTNINIASKFTWEKTGRAIIDGISRL